MTINPKDAKPDQAHEVRYRSERYDIGEITPLVPTRKITRDDLPSDHELRRIYQSSLWRTNAFVAVLDAVVAHLNERGGVPDEKPRKSDYVLNDGKCCEEAALTASELDAERRLRASEVEYWSGRAGKAEAELDEARSLAARNTVRWSEESAKVRELTAECGKLRRQCYAAIAERDDLRGRVEEVENERIELQARLNAAEVDRLTRERDEAQEEIAAQKRNLLGRIEEVETERDELQAQLKDAKNQRDHYMERLAMRHAQPKPNAAEDRPTLDSEAVMKCLRDAWTTDDYGPPAFSFVSATNAIMALTPAVEGWPEWLGPRVDPDDFEVTRDAEGNYRLECHTFAGKETTPDDLRNGWAGGGVRDKAKREAVARFIESEQAVTGDEDQRIEKAAEKLWLADRTGVVSWNELHVDMQCRYRDEAARLLDAGWTPPESENK